MKYKFKKGDISLLVTILVCGIILILLAPLAQKISVETNISRENLMSQQAIQAAKTGLDEFKYNLNNMSLNGFDLNSQAVWPNSSTITSNIIQDSGVYWVELDNDLGTQYRIEYIPSKDPSVDPKIIARARVKKNSFTIERTFEENIKRIPDNCTGLNHSATRTQSCPSGQVGERTEQCNDGRIVDISNTCRAPICSTITTTENKTWSGNEITTSSQDPDQGTCFDTRPGGGSGWDGVGCGSWNCRSLGGQRNCGRSGRDQCYRCQCSSCYGTLSTNTQVCR